MHVLLFGGNRFLGIELTAQLLTRGHQVTLFNRGSLVDPFDGSGAGERVARVRGDRDEPATLAPLAQTQWDAVVDFSLFTAAQARHTAAALAGRVGHYVMVSTGQVYLVRDQVPSPATEADFDGPLAPEPAAPHDRAEWAYGVDKRAAEAVIAEAFPATRLRIPMVHGARDYHRRIDSLLWRFLDGGPIYLTQPDAPCRHVYGPAVVRTMLELLTRGPTGTAFNLAMPEVVTVEALVRALAAVLGAQNELRTVDAAALTAAGVDPLKASPFNDRWMSVLDPAEATRAGLLRHEALAEWVPAVVHATLGRWQGPPPSLAQRAAELRFR